MDPTFDHLPGLSRKVHSLLTLAVPVQDFILASHGLYHRHFAAIPVLEKTPGKSKKDKKRREAVKSAATETPVGSLPLLDGTECIWSAHVRNAWHTLHWMQKASKCAKQIIRSLPNLPIEIPPEKHACALVGWRSHPHRAQVLRVLSRYKVEPSVAQALDRRLDDVDGDWSQLFSVDSLTALVTVLETTSDAFGHWVRHILAPACSRDARREALSRLIPKTNPEFKIDCMKLEGEAQTVCFIVGIIIIVVTLVVIIVDAIGSWIDWIEDDDNARAEVNRRSCSELAALSNPELASLVRRMLDGWTVDDDERTILRILECLPCDRVQQIVNDVGRGNLLNDFDGSEWDRLMIRLQQCGLATFRDWDDDATRRFINEVSCATINSLSEDDIRQLMFNLFEGHTGDADERAILRVMECLDCARIRSLVRRSGMSVDDFDDEVDGEEWDRLERRFLACGVR